MNEYYVYMYLDQNNCPFYIGKGTGPRYKVSRHFNTKQSYLVRKINKIGIDNIKIHFLNESLTPEKAIAWERYWIKRIGRANKKEGTLCNLTDGGDGSSGHIQSEKTKELRRQVMNNLIKEGKVFGEEHRKRISKGRTGIYHTKEAKLKMSENFSLGIKRSKLKERDIINIMEQHRNGIYYKEIAKQYNVVPRHIYNIVNGYCWNRVTGVINGK